MSDMNVNNDYTKMNNLTPFKLCVLQNFPFIEADFDAVTNYQLLCKVVEYLNNVIDNNNKQNTNITQLEQNFITLYNYVKDYFNNLDVQEEINNKIDELITSGSFATLFKSFIGYVMPEWYGAVGDGVHDDTVAFNNAISTGMPVVLGVNKHYILKNNITLNTLWGNNSIVEFLIDITDSPVRELAQAISIKKEIRDITIISPNGFISVYSADNVNIENVICLTNNKTLKNTSTNGSVIQINNSHHISIKNVDIDTSYTVNTASESTEYLYNDGIHINGGSHDILIENVSGKILDDLIAFNTVEGISVDNKDIYNVTVNNVYSNKSYGFRFYGFADVDIYNIYNISINNCIIHTNNNVPAVRFLNSVGLGGQSKTRINCYNVTFNNCDFESNNSTVYFTRCTGDVIFNNCVFRNSNTHTFNSENSVAGDKAMNLTIIHCTFISGDYQPLRLLGWVANTTDALSVIIIKDSLFSSKGVFLVTNNMEKVVVENCNIDCASLIGGGNTSVQLSLVNCDCKNTQISIGDLFEEYYISNCKMANYGSNNYMIYIIPNNAKNIIISGDIKANNGLTSITQSASVKYRLKGLIQQNTEPTIHEVGDYYIDTQNKAIKIY